VCGRNVGQAKAIECYTFGAVVSGGEDAIYARLDSLKVGKPMQSPASLQRHAQETKVMINGIKADAEVAVETNSSSQAMATGMMTRMMNQPIYAHGRHPLPSTAASSFSPTYQAAGGASGSRIVARHRQCRGTLMTVR
jgi:hypothetical protein